MENDSRIEIAKHDYRVINDLRNLIYIRDNEQKINEYIHLFPKLDEFKNKAFRIGYFRIDLYNFFCSCSRFTENSLLFKEERDIKRCCHHFFKVLFSKKLLFNRYDSLTKAILKTVFLYGKELFISEEINSKNVILGYKEISDLQWVSVYAAVNDKNDYRKFGYNLVEKRWRSEIAPPDADEIASFAENSFIAKRNSYFK